jgi:hypothetical protein
VQAAKANATVSDEIDEMSFAAHRPWFSLLTCLVVSLVFIIMPLEQSFSFIPTTKYSKEHALFLIPSQVNIKTLAPASASTSAKQSRLPLIPSQIKSTASQRQEKTRCKMTETSSSNATLIASFTQLHDDESSHGASKQKRKRSKRKRRKHMKNGDIRRSRILMGNFPDIHWYVAK